MNRSEQANRKPPPSSGLTLIELMFSLAIVALLTTASLSLYRWSRMRAATSLSSQNLHQLVIANLTYASDNGGYFCPAQEPRNLRRWHGSRSNTEEEFKPEGGFLTPYLSKDRKLETCPLLLKYLKGGQSFEDGAGGYGYNAAYIGGRPGDAYAPVALLDLEAPGRTVMFTTTALSKEAGVQEYPFSEPWFAATERGERAYDLQPSVHFRAGGKAIVAWCDGRISLEAPPVFKDTNYYGGNNEKDSIGWFGPEKENGFWNPASSAVLNGWNRAGEALANSQGSSLAGAENADQSH
jgi:prepilin-type N-terminal cleavage/methylation domain-containing protein